MLDLDNIIQKLECSSYERELLHDEKKLKDILELGIKAYNRNYILNGNLTSREQVLFRILKKYDYKWLSSQQLVDFYNWELYKDKTYKYMQVASISKKIQNINKKLEGMYVENRYGIGYKLKYIYKTN